MELHEGKYQIQGIDVSSIAKQFGTPVFVYDGKKIVDQLQNLKNAFSENPLKVKFALKALSNISILKLLHKHGAGMDAVSINEAKLALGVGVNKDDINFTPSCVDFSEIVEGVDLGVSVNLDNLTMLEKFGKKYGSSYPCGLRLNPHIMAGGNYKISTGHGNSKFGISIYQLPDVMRLVQQHNIVINGLHIHTGS